MCRHGPGFHPLVRAGIETQQEAEKLLRGTAFMKKPARMGGETEGRSSVAPLPC